VDYLVVPVPMCIDVAKNNLETPFQLFLLLKFLYRNGKTKLSAQERKAIAKILGNTKQKSLKKNIHQLQELKWLRHNSATGYYQIHSFDRLREKNDWPTRSGIVCYFDDLNHIFAIEGAALYIYLYKDFWRKVKRDKVVRIKGRTYHSLPGTFHSKGRFAPVATTGVNALFDISISKASRLKHAAIKAGFIEVIKDFKELPIKPSEINLVRKYFTNEPNLVILKDKVCLQLIDLILPNIPFKKRHKLKT